MESVGTMVALSGAEYRLLRVFLDYPPRVLNRDQLLNLTQGRDTEPFDRSIDLLVSRLRQRLKEDAREPRYIKTGATRVTCSPRRSNCGIRDGARTKVEKRDHAVAENPVRPQHYRSLFREQLIIHMRI